MTFQLFRHATSLLILQLLLYIRYSLTYPYSVNNGFQISDLMLTDATSFGIEAASWSSFGLNGTSNSSMCYGLPLLGGYSILNYNGYFQKTYGDLPIHDIIYFAIKVTVIDDWRSPDTAIVQFDSKNFSTGDVALSKPYFPNSICGNPTSTDLSRVYIMGKVFHTRDTVTLRIISLINRSPNNASFGIREVSLLLTNKTGNDTENSCFASGAVPIISNNCTCRLQQYFGSSGQCLACNPTCATCFGPNANQCYKCNSGSSFIGDQCVKCDSSCTECFGPSPNQCLRCPVDSWYGWDNTCREICNSPSYAQQIIGTVKLCKVPCNSTQFYLWNYTCSDNCLEPFSQRTSELGQFCNLPCGSEKYYNWNKSCITNCNPPLISTNSSGFLTCNLPCYSGEYLYPNGTCLQECISPFIFKKINNVFTCNYPCSFTTGEFLTWNGSCADACIAPSYQRIEENMRFCDTCRPGYYRYTNNTCLPYCNSPFQVIMINQSQFCNNPCSSTKILYFNGTCLNNCNTPYLLNGTGDYTICNPPCQKSSDFLYPNKSCRPTCPYPWRNTTTYDVEECSPPCSGSQYFSTSDQSCISSCDPPNEIIMTQDAIAICNIYSMPQTLTDDSQKRPIDFASTIANAASTSMTAGIVISMVIGCGNPAIHTLGGFVKMLPYIRYMKINYPPRLELMLDNMNSSIVSFNFGVKMSSQMQSKFKQYSLPEKFERYQLSSSFLVSYWQTLTSMTMIILVIVILAVVSYLLRKLSNLNRLILRIKLIFQWNFLLMILCTNLDAIVLSTSLDLRTLHLHSAGGLTSFAACIVMNFVATFVLGLIIYVIRDIRRNRNQICSEKMTNKPRNILCKWENFQLFFKGSKEDTFIQHVFLFPYLLRLYIFYLIISYLFEYPLLQAILITLLSVFILSYILLKRPFRSRLVFCQHTSDEVTMALVNVSMLSLAVLDSLHIEAKKARETLGDVIIYLNLLFSITANIYLLLYLGVGIKDAIRNTKAQKTKGILAWLVVFLAPFEAGGMDVDVMPEEALSSDGERRELRILPTYETQRDMLEVPKSTLSGLQRIRKISNMIVHTDTNEAENRPILSINKDGVLTPQSPGAPDIRSELEFLSTVDTNIDVASMQNLVALKNFHKYQVRILTPRISVQLHKDEVTEDGK